MLTSNQQHALDSLFTYTAEKHEPGTAALHQEPLHQEPLRQDWLETWFGLSHDQLKGYLADLLVKKDAWESHFLNWVEGNPLESAFGFLGVAAAAFYLAEKEANPKIATYVDAFYYIATCASVGYADVFAMTQSGKAIASLVMIVGPGLADRALNRPQTPANGS